MNLLQLIIQNVRLHQGYGLMSRWEHLARWPRRRSHDGQPARSSGRQNVFLWGNNRKYCEGMKSMISDDIVVTQPKKRLTFKFDINDIKGYKYYNQYVFFGGEFHTFVGHRGPNFQPSPRPAFVATPRGSPRHLKVDHTATESVAWHRHVLTFNLDLFHLKKALCIYTYISYIYKNQYMGKSLTWNNKILKIFSYLSIYLSVCLSIYHFISLYLTLPYLSLPYLLSAPSMPYLILSTYLSIMFYLSTSLSTCKSIHMEWTCWTLREGKITKRWFPRATPAPPTNKNIRINQNHIKYVFV